MPADFFQKWERLLAQVVDMQGVEEQIQDLPRRFILYHVISYHIIVIIIMFIISA